MQPIEERLFQCWCRHGDAQALGELFDFAAPQLLKLAIHLVGDATAAEDLVQSTFLALIEQRAKIDASRPVMPWLSGVLSNKAQQFRRERAKAIDVERLHQRAVDDPSAPLEQRELSGELAAAIDRLDEPYRQVLLLRVRHGMQLADIAHVLERDPGTVSVQLHRGLERLRRILPAALTSSLLLGWFTPRGLAAIKASVLSEASAAAAVTSWTSILGGLLVGKKAIAAVCLILLVLLFHALRPQAPTAAPQPHRESAAASNAIETPKPAEPSAESARTTAQPTELAGPTLASIVVDAESGVPLPDASVALFTGRETTSIELRRDHPEYYDPSQGRLSTLGDWPRLVGADDLAFAGRRKLLSLDKPEAGQKALARTTSDAQGEFTLPAMSEIGLVEVALAGYDTRWRPFAHRELPATISIWRAREISGAVIDESGAPITEPLELIFWALGDPSKEVRELDAQESAFVRSARDRTLDREGIECERVMTASDGTFRATVGTSNRLFARVLTPGWVTPQGLAKPEPDGKPMIIRAARVPLLHFFDANTLEPIERVRLIARQVADGHTMFCGEVLAPAGLVVCPANETGSRKRTLAFTAWAEGFEPATWISADRLESTRVEVPMHAGVLSTLDGIVVRGNAPVDGASVSLLGDNPAQFTPYDTFASPLLDALMTSAGAFHFDVPAGKYLLQIRDSAAEIYTVVEAPSAAPIVIDLDTLGAIEIKVVDENNTPRAAALIALAGGEGRSGFKATDASGIAVFDALPAGRYTVMASPGGRSSDFGVQVHQELELAQGQRASVRFELRSSVEKRHAILVAHGVDDYTGWRVKYLSYDWIDVASDGTIPTDVTTTAYELLITAPDGRHWTSLIRKKVPDGYLVELDAGDARLEGELVDAKGQAIAGVTIQALPTSTKARNRIAVRATTDAAGHFSLSGLAAADHTLSFERSSVPLQMEFTPNFPASDAPPWLRVQLSTPEDVVRVNGTVRDNLGKPLAEAMIRAESSIPQAQGVLRVDCEKFTLADAEGRYRLTLMRTPNLKLSVSATEYAPILAERAFTDDGSAERTLDLTTN